MEHSSTNIQEYSYYTVETLPNWKWRIKFVQRNSSKAPHQSSGHAIYPVRSVVLEELYILQVSAVLVILDEEC